MKKNTYRIFITTIIIAVVLFAANMLLYTIPGTGLSAAGFVYPIAVTYLMFLILTLIVLAVLVYIADKNKEQLGYAFLFATAVKMAICYVLARPIIAKTIDGSTEKTNFFIIFILFLAIEAYYTARLLNNK